MALGLNSACPAVKTLTSSCPVLLNHLTCMRLLLWCRRRWRRLRNLRQRTQGHLREAQRQQRQQHQHLLPPPPPQQRPQPPPRQHPALSGQHRPRWLRQVSKGLVLGEGAREEGQLGRRREGELGIREEGRWQEGGRGSWEGGRMGSWDQGDGWESWKKRGVRSGGKGRQGQEGACGREGEGMKVTRKPSEPHLPLRSGPVLGDRIKASPYAKVTSQAGVSPLNPDTLQGFKPILILHAIEYWTPPR